MRIVRRPERGRPATPISMDDSFEDAPMPMEYLHGMAIQARWSGTSLDGTLSLEVSNHAFANNTGNELLPTGEQVWTALTGSDVAISTDSGDHMWDISEMYYEAVRVVYESTAGTGTIELFYLGKSDAA